MELTTWYGLHAGDSLRNRYTTINDIVPLLQVYKSLGELSVIGESVHKRPLYLLKVGKGPRKIMMWSQMHGNESTTTRSVFDLLAFLKQGGEGAAEILNNCTLYIIPMLNPDGAQAYTRVNANNVDLNRDATNISQPESFALRGVFNRISPDFCFNLHDQRTIFNTGDSARPATLSFLSPATDDERHITLPRKKSMEVIVAINNTLQKLIPGQVGRYDDTFNINCVGDCFQSLGVPTLLFEAGHYPEDYTRGKTREYVFYALVTALKYIAGNEVNGEGYPAYFDIPENSKRFFDILIRNFPVKAEGAVRSRDIGVLYKEDLTQDRITFTPYIAETGELNEFYGHKEFDATDFNPVPIEEKSLKTNELLKLFL